jgi:hypothetical protein
MAKAMAISDQRVAHCDLRVASASIVSGFLRAVLVETGQDGRRDLRTACWRLFGISQIRLGVWNRCMGCPLPHHPIAHSSDPALDAASRYDHTTRAHKSRTLSRSTLSAPATLPAQPARIARSRSRPPPPPEPFGSSNRDGVSRLHTIPSHPIATHPAPSVFIHRSDVQAPVTTVLNPRYSYSPSIPTAPLPAREPPKSRQSCNPSPPL